MHERRAFREPGVCCGGEAERQRVWPDFPLSSPMVTHPRKSPGRLTQIKTCVGKQHEQVVF